MSRPGPVSILTFVLCLAAGAAALAAPKPDRDTDRDKLSDYQEIHKYGTDPKKRDSDGDGKPDGEWDERREYAYTIRSVVKVMHPTRPEVMCDDYQDARVLSRTEAFTEYEVVHYPFNTNEAALSETRQWKRPAAKLREFLKPGLVTNWDKEMQKDLLAALTGDGIDPAALADRALVEKTVNWLLDRGKYRYMFGTYFVHFPHGKPEIYPGLDEAFRKETGNAKLPLAEHWQHELFGKGMYENRSYGTCTSTAIYLTTGLRAVGIPTRMILAIPVIDPGDGGQFDLIRKNITHRGARAVLGPKLYGMGTGFTSHTFNEVFVGGRWRRLNYRKLGQNTYGPGAMGMLTHIHTFNDLSEAGLTETWGVRYGLKQKDEVFRHDNPYRTTELDDRFGVHGKVENPPIQGPTDYPVAKAYWFLSEDRPASIDPRTVKEDGSGHVLFHVTRSMSDLNIGYWEMDKEFRLEAEGVPPVRARAERGFWNQDCYLRIPPAEYGKMKPGVAYRLVAANAGSSRRWIVSEDVSLTKPK